MPDIRGQRETRTAPMPVAASRFKNREVFTPSGQSGRVASVLIGDDGKHYAVVDFGPDVGMHQVPISKVSYERNRFVIREPDARALPSFVAGQKGMRSVDPGATLDIPGYRLADADDSTILVQNAAPQVTVERPALAINWEQAPPEVTVHQPTPQVNVRQLQPVIIVRQPPPKITVELEQPEIIVRMPDPEVDVSIAEPEVQVSVAKPKVQIVQPEQPQVRITAGEPLVSLVPRNPADVAIERNQPRVHYERMGEPQLFFRQLDGGPRVRFEEMPRDEARRTAAETPRAAATLSERTMLASQLEGARVYSMDGEEVGAVERVLVGQDNRLHVVMVRGGFLGFAAHRIVLPASSLAVRGDRLYVRNMNADQVGRIDAWDERMDQYTTAASDRSVPFSLLP